MKEVAQEVNKEEARFKRLRYFNGFMSLLHLIQGVLMWILSSDFSLPVTTAYLRFNPQTEELVQNFQQAWQLRIGPLVAVFLFISALAHFCLATFGFRWYVNKLKNSINPARWYEYALSSSLMIVIIAMLAGMYDLSSLILIFALNATMILFGLVTEVFNDPGGDVNWLPFNLGCLAGAVPWITIGLYLYGAGSVPNFVYGIFGSIFLFFNVFALNMFLQYQSWRSWRDYIYGERVYILLSLFAKSALAWQVFAGTLRPM